MARRRYRKTRDGETIEDRPMTEDEERDARRQEFVAMIQGLNPLQITVPMMQHAVKLWADGSHDVPEDILP